MVCVRELHRAGRRLPFGFEVVGFAEEEGQRYKATFLGSGALTGHFDAAWLDQRDADGIDACARRCAPPACRPRCRPSPRCSATRRVTSASSRCTSSRARCSTSSTCRWAWSPRSTAACATVGEVIGMASHAGTTPMDRRRDAATAVGRTGAVRREACRRRAEPGRHHRHARRCPTARSTSCPAAASSAWTCAPPPTKCAMRCARRRARRAGQRSASAAACTSSSRRPCAPPPRPARRPGSDAGNAPSSRSACRCSACPAAPATTR